MYLIREVMYCKPGNVRELVEKFKGLSEAAESMGDIVESSPGAAAVGRAYLFAPRFLWECLNIPTVTRFPGPAHRTGLADFPHPALGLVSHRGIRGRHLRTSL